MSLRDIYGKTIASISDGKVYDDSGRAVYEIIGDRLYEVGSHRYVFEIRGSRIYAPGGGTFLYEVRDNRIYTFSGSKLGELD